MRDVTREQEAACRDNAIKAIAGFMTTLDGKTDPEKFAALCAKFDKVAEATCRASENCDPDKLPERLEKDPTLANNLCIILEAAVKGEKQMEAILMQMAELKNSRGEALHQVNGTSEMYGDRANALQAEQSFIRINREYIGTGVVPEGCLKRSEHPLLKCAAAKISQFLAAFLFLPEAVSVLC